MFELSNFEKSLVAKGNLIETWAGKFFFDEVLVSHTGMPMLYVCDLELINTNVIWIS